MVVVGWGAEDGALREEKEREGGWPKVKDEVSWIDRWQNENERERNPLGRQKETIDEKKKKSPD